MALGEGQLVKIDESHGLAHNSMEYQVSEPVCEEPNIVSPGRVEGHQETIDQVQAPVFVNSPKDPSCSGTSTLPLSPNVNLFLNNVSFLGFDWIEGLRKLSLSGRASSYLPPLVPPLIPVEEELGKDTLPAAVLTARAPDLFLAVEEPSSVCLEPDPETPLEESCPSPSESSDSAYFLRSRTKSALGLAKVSSTVRRGRGRKTNLSKAQSRAKEDLMEGKQQSIESALGAKKAKKRGRK